MDDYNNNNSYSSLTVNTLAGIAGGVSSVLVGHPLDTVKVQMQLFPNTYGSMLKSIVNTFRRRGVRGLYAGSTPALASNCAENAVTFGTYGLCQRIVSDAVNGPGGAIDGLSYVENAAAGGISSIFSSMVICPTELIKIRMQGVPELSLQSPSISQVVKKLWKASGPMGLYRGLGWTLARESIGCTAFFGSYEWTREQLKPVGKRKEDCTPLATLMAGAVAGLLNWSLIYPIDVIKSRVQIKNKSSGFQMARDEFQNMGLRGLYCGLWPTLLKSVPVTAVLLFTVEFSKPFYRNCLSKMATVPSIKPASNFFSFCDFMSGWMAGIVSTFVGHPMDTVRIVQQVTNTKALQATRDVYKRDKFSGYFRGMMFPLLSMGVTNSVFFGINGNVMRMIQRYRSDNETDDEKDVRFCCEAEHLNKYWHLDVIVSGCLGGFCYSLINIPSEVVKTILQASNIKPENPENVKTTQSTKVTSPVKLIVELYKKNGIRSLYQGGTLLMIRDVPCMGIYMVTYEHMCCVLKTSWYNETTKNEPIPKQIQMISGGTAGVASWMFVLPFDVIKSKIIADSLTAEPVYKGAWDCAKKTYRKGGVGQFFRGFWLLCFRAFPVNGIAFVVYEVLMDTCGKQSETTAISDQNSVSKWS